MSSSNKANDIIKCKYKADPIQYFNLFDKYIPANLKRKDIYIRDISNIDVLYNIIKKNSSNNYFINDTEDVFKLLEINCRIDFPKTNLIFYNPEKLDMKFDLIIMNPPYQKNLHLKILEEAINHMKDEDSVCVNLSPVRWLQDPIAQYKKLSDYKRFEENVSKHIETLNVFSMKDVNTFFDIAIFSDIGIYKIRNYQIKGFDYKEFNESKFANCKTIRDKIFSYMLSDETHTCFYHLTTNENNDDYRVIITLIVGHPGEQHLKHYYEFPSRNEIYKNGVDIYLNKKSESRKTNKPTTSRTTINFKTENEAKNFISYSKLNIMTFCGIISKSDMHPQFKFFPFLGEDAINPRTGKRGYESEWTDEDLYTFFNITPEEQKIIEEILAEYK